MWQHLISATYSLFKNPRLNPTGNGRKKNKYRLLKFFIILNLLIKRKVTFRKILNALHCYAAYFFKGKKSALAPLMINFEIWNECNESCLYCRNARGEIYDQNPEKTGAFIAKGQMPLSLYQAIIGEVKDELLLSVPYMNGEPLIYPSIIDLIKWSTQNHVATMIATNGILLDEKRGRELIEAGLDFIKIHLSGFSQSVHQIEHRQGNVEKVKRNIESFVKINRELGNKTIVLIDYILYEHNKHELALMREFAENLGVLFNIRPGDPRSLENSEKPQTSGPLPLDMPCDWLWKVLSIDWDGAILPCCDYAIWSGARPYGRYEIGKTLLKELWNGEKIQKMRVLHKTTGRHNINICSRCARTGIAFKW